MPAEKKWKLPGEKAGQWGTSIILPYFKVNGINSLDLLIMTHPDSDHIAGTVDILKTIPVKRIITNGEIAENKVSIEDLQKSLVMGLQKYVQVEEPEDEEVEILAAEKELGDLDEQFSSNMISDEDLKNSMQIHEGDEDEDSFDLDSETGEIGLDDGEDFGEESFDDADDLE